MGILNLTPDSFSDGGLHLDPARAVAAGLQMEADGADIIDIGGESTRPGSKGVSVDEELRRVLPVVEGLAGRLRVPISIDTTKAPVAARAAAAGAEIVNDISGLRYDPRLGAVIAETGCAAVLMHTRGRPREMYREAVYDDVLADVTRELAVCVATALAAGVPRAQIVLDPGLGFAKRPAHNYELLARLPALAALDCPLLVGPSRKSFLQPADAPAPPAARDWATGAVVAALVLAGAHIVRVHAVREMVEIVRVTDLIRQAAAPWRLTGTAG
jgi:dihydropteroate synthase